MCCGGECCAQRWLMQHAAVAVAPRCANGVNNFDIHFHEIDLPLPSILVFVPTNSVSRFHQFRYSFPSIQIPVPTNFVVPSHEFGFSLSPIRLFLSTNSNSRFYEFNFPLLRILIFLPTNSTPHSHEFQHSLPPIQAFLLTNVGKQKRRLTRQTRGRDSTNQKKVIHLHHEHTRTFSIGAVDSAIRDTFKL